MLDWKEIHSIRCAPLHTILDKHKVVFEDGLGKMKGFEAKILVDAEAVPKFCNLGPYFWRCVRKSKRSCNVLHRRNIGAGGIFLLGSPYHHRFES